MIEKLPAFDELTFEERGHLYKLNGIAIPSVTTAMKPLSDSYYGSVDINVLETAAQRGTAVHNAIENYLNYAVKDIPAEYDGYFLAFKNWYHENDVKVIATETKVYHRVLRYAGTVDMLCFVNGMKVLVDFKTSAEIIKMLTSVQLEAYVKAYDSHSIKVDGKAVLHLRKDGTYYYDPDYPMRDSEAWEVFGSCLSLQNYLRKYRRKY